MRAAWVSLLVLACASRANEGRSRAADPGPSAAAPGVDAGDGNEAEGCAADSDCALTRVPAGGCCPILCAPRVVTRKRADALEAAIPICHKGRECPEPVCRPLPREIVPACVQGRCLGKDVGLPN